jgi:hypothetical protein
MSIEAFKTRLGALLASLWRIEAACEHEAEAAGLAAGLGMPCVPYCGECRRRPAKYGTTLP